MVEKAGYCSLEFIIGDDTYWLRTSSEIDKDADPVYYFSKIPKSEFRNRPLIARALVPGQPFSGFFVMGEIGNISTHKYGSWDYNPNGDTPEKLIVEIFFSESIDKFPILRWQDMYRFLLSEGKTIEELVPFWYRHLVEFKSGTGIKHRYIVSVFQYNAEKQGGSTSLSLIRSDASLSNIKDQGVWITYRDHSTEQFEARLEDLNIIAVNFNNEYWYV